VCLDPSTSRTGGGRTSARSIAIARQTTASIWVRRGTTIHNAPWENHITANSPYIPKMAQAIQGRSGHGISSFQLHSFPSVRRAQAARTSLRLTPSRPRGKAALTAPHYPSMSSGQDFE
jgi:hypothetical protein